MSLKIKLLSFISAFILMLSIMLLGVYAANQSINLSGNINFQISDKSLWVKDVRISNDNYTEESIESFMPGYINGEFNLGIPSIANQYGSFTLYFDIINTTQIPQHVSVDYSGLSISGLEVTVTSDIAGNSEELTEITAETPVTTTLELAVTNPNLEDIDLSKIIINIEPFVIGTLTYTYDEENFTVEVSGCSSSNAEIIIIPETVEYNGQTYTVTSIIGSVYNGGGYDTHFAISTLQSVYIPETITSIGFAAFYNSGLETAYFKVPEGWSINHGHGYESVSFSDPYSAASKLKSISGGMASDFIRS